MNARGELVAQVSPVVAARERADRRRVPLDTGSHRNEGRRLGGMDNVGVVGREGPAQVRAEMTTQQDKSLPAWWSALLSCSRIGAVLAAPRRNRGRSRLQ
jgi:hypothetical protein